MNKKKLPIMIVSILLVIAVFAGIAVVVTKMTMNDPASVQETEAAVQESTAAAAAGSVDELKALAEAMIGQTLTRDEIEGTLGACEEFDMNNNGCERGVYAGKFFYKGFTIKSRTYDKGKTFKVVSVD